MHENGIVLDTLHSEGHFRTETFLETRYKNGEPDMGLVQRHRNDPSTWGVVFRCDHGNKFAIQGSTEEYKKLWEKMDPGMNVVIIYKEVYRSIYRDIDGDGKRDLVTKELVDYDFIDANPRK